MLWDCKRHPTTKSSDELNPYDEGTDNFPVNVFVLNYLCKSGIHIHCLRVRFNLCLRRNFFTSQSCDMIFTHITVKIMVYYWHDIQLSRLAIA